MPKKISQKQKLKSSISNVIKIAIGERNKRKQKRRRRVVKRTDEGMSSQQQKPQAQPQVITVNVPPYPMPPNYGSIKRNEPTPQEGAGNSLADALRTLEQRQARFETDTQNYIAGTYQTLDKPINDLAGSVERAYRGRKQNERDIKELQQNFQEIQPLLMSILKQEPISSVSPPEQQQESKPLSQQGESGIPMLTEDQSDYVLQGGGDPGNTNDLGTIAQGAGVGGGGGGLVFTDAPSGSPGVVSTLTQSQIRTLTNAQVEFYYGEYGGDVRDLHVGGNSEGQYKNKGENQNRLITLLGLEK